MSGIGGQEARGKLVTVQTPLPESVDGITDAIRSIILLGEVQHISIANGEPIVYQRIVREGEEVAPKESTQSFAELTTLEVVRNVPMGEWVSEDGEMRPIEKVFWMFMEMAAKGLVVTHLLVGEGSEFWEWLGLPGDAYESIDQFLGARIERDQLVPGERFILCGSKTRGATSAEIEYSLVGSTFEVTSEEADKESN